MECSAILADSLGTTIFESQGPRRLSLCPRSPCSYSRAGGFDISFHRNTVRGEIGARKSIANRKHIGLVPAPCSRKFMVEHRQEQRSQRDLAVEVTGRDANGTPFTQSATATNTSRSGALLSGLSGEMRSGDLLLVEYQKRKARFKVVWARDSRSERLKIQAAIQRMEKEECPWLTSLNCFKTAR